MITIEQFREKYLDASGAIVFVPGTSSYFASSFRADAIDSIDFCRMHADDSRSNTLITIMRIYVGAEQHIIETPDLDHSKTRHYQEFVNRIWSEALSFCKYRR